MKKKEKQDLLKQESTTRIIASEISLQLENEKDYGREQIESTSQQNKRKLVKQVLRKELGPNTALIPSTDLKGHLSNLREASSGSMNLLDNTTQHLHDLMITVASDAKEANPENAWARDNVLAVKQVVDVSRQLANVMRLKLDTVKALHKISLDIAKTEN